MYKLYFTLYDEVASKILTRGPDFNVIATNRVIGGSTHTYLFIQLYSIAM